MKKIFLLLIPILVGCTIAKTNANSPIYKVELMFSNYQTLNSEVIKDLNDVVALEPDLTTEQRDKYKGIMKKHYQNLKYVIKNERVDGNIAVVTVEIEVTDYTKEKARIEQYLKTNPDMFKDKNNQFSTTKYNDYKLEQLKETKDKVKYTIDLQLTKVKKEWVLEPLTQNQEKKLHGIYVLK